MSGVTYIGIDAGGSRLRVRARNELKTIGFETEGVNLWRDGIAVAAERLGRAVRRATSETGKPDRFAVVAAVAGAMDAERARSLEQRLGKDLEELASGQVSILSDIELAHRAAHGSDAGITVVVGTGSVVLTSDSSGCFRVTGGWGYKLGDEGSGYALGADTLRTIAAAIDRGENTSLEMLAEPRPGESLRSAVLRRAYGEEARIQDLAPALLRQAASGLPEAVSVVERQVAVLVEQIRMAREMADEPVSRIAITGGLASDSFYRECLSRMLRQVGPDVEIMHVDIDPLEEALRMAAAISR